MYATICGTLNKITPIYVVLETGGIGYQIFITTTLYPKLPEIGEKLLLYTSFVVRELSQTLYGFATEQEKEIFETLMAINGIGPKIALSILGHLPEKELLDAITTRNIALICKVPGIGKKSAERLIIELKDKLSTLIPQNTNNLEEIEINLAQTKITEDAISALINLGYSQMMAKKAVDACFQEKENLKDLPSLITASLKYI